MKKAPCKGCEKRFAGCHATCDAYIEWKKYRNELAEHIRQIRVTDADSVRINGIFKTKKESHR